MRILHLGKYWARDGGIETHVKTLCKGLASAGIDVVNLVSSVNRKENRFLQDGYAVFESQSIGVISSTSIAPKMLADVRRLNAERKFDLIHLHFPDPMSHLASMALPNQIPKVITWHSDIVNQRCLLNLYRPFQRAAITHSKAIIVASAANFKSSSQIPECYPVDQRHVIPFGFDFEWLRPTRTVLERAKATREGSQGRFFVFALGRHVAYKGFDVLIDALRTTSAFLILGGVGPLTPTLKTQVRRLGLENRVKFTGRLSLPELAAHYHACDVFCLPSVSGAEAFGIVQIEAMACGKPVICTQLNNGVNEVNPHGVTGLSVPVRDSAALADAINQLANDSGLCEALGKQAKERVLKNYSTASMVDQHRRLYRKIISSSIRENGLPLS